MKWKTKFIETMKRYKHAWVFLYALIYMPWFWFLEKHVTMNYHVVQTALDEEIPFIEYFIVPYMLWFVFIAATFLYFFRYRCTGILQTGEDFVCRNDNFSLLFVPYFRMVRIYDRLCLSGIIFL